MREILLVAQAETFSAGSAIITQGTEGKKFYIIASGVVTVFIGSKMKVLNISILFHESHFSLFTQHLIAGDFLGM